jgi:uncharacterized protein (TIGR02001 family)
MRKTIFVAALAAAGLTPPALAADPAAIPRAFTISADANLVSDYRFRGISQSDRRPALQGDLNLQHVSGFYATVWASSIAHYAGNGAGAEIDLTAGWRRTQGGTTFDGGVTYYFYPGGHGADYVEPYASIAESLGPVTAKLSVNYAPKQRSISAIPGLRDDNLYLGGDLTGSLPGTPLTLDAHFGHSWGPSNLSIGRAYSDWSLGATVTPRRHLVLGLHYVDANRDLITPRGRDASGAGLVGSIGLSF